MSNSCLRPGKESNRGWKGWDLWGGSGVGGHDASFPWDLRVEGRVPYISGEPAGSKPLRGASRVGRHQCRGYWFWKGPQQMHLTSASQSTAISLKWGKQQSVSNLPKPGKVPGVRMEKKQNCVLVATGHDGLIVFSNECQNSQTKTRWASYIVIRSGKRQDLCI